MRSIYTRDGWLDIPAIRSFGCWLNILIGARQVGKTYGVSKDLIDRGNPFIFMRISAEELKAICGDPELDPWIKLDEGGYNVRMRKVAGAKTYAIGTMDEAGRITDRIGTGVALSTIASVRGFAGEQYTDLFFDEIIPEQYVPVRAAMGDAFVNAYITINGNRELKGKPPLTVWLLANSNNIHSPILESLNVLDELDALMASDAEYTVTDDGVCIVLAKSRQVTDKRKDTAMLRRLNKQSDIYRMAVNNEFSYDSLEAVKKHSLAGWSPYLNIGDLGIWQNGAHLYCTTSKGKAPAYGKAKEEIERCGRDHPELRLMYINGYMTFYSTACMLKFKEVFKLY